MEKIVKNSIVYPIYFLHILKPRILNLKKKKTVEILAPEMSIREQGYIGDCRVGVYKSVEEVEENKTQQVHGLYIKVKKTTLYNFPFNSSTLSLLLVVVVVLIIMNLIKFFKNKLQST